MLSLVLIQDVCGAASPPVVKNGDKWKLSRVSKGRETIITLATCDVHTLSVKVALILMALSMGIKRTVYSFLHHCDKFRNVTIIYFVRGTYKMERGKLGPPRAAKLMFGVKVFGFTCLLNFKLGSKKVKGEIQQIIVIFFF